eukprot:scaffold58701_cov51-Phaeocystis_antarctica.AAC.2
MNVSRMRLNLERVASFWVRPSPAHGERMLDGRSQRTSGRVGANSASPQSNSTRVLAVHSSPIVAVFTFSGGMQPAAPNSSRHCPSSAACCACETW